MKSSSYKKALILLGLALIIGGVLWMVSSASAAGTLFTKVKVVNEKNLAGVEYNSITIDGIRAEKVLIEMFAGQVATVEFKTGADVLDALIVNDDGEVIEIIQFNKGSGSIDFSDSGTRILVLLDPGGDQVYGDYDTREVFLERCEKNFSVISKERTIEDILKESGKGSFTAVVETRVKIVQQEITSVKAVWSYDEENADLQLRITAESNLPYETEVSYSTFGVDGKTKKVDRNGNINFVVDFDKIDINSACKIEMQTGSMSAEFDIEKPPAEVGIFIEPTFAPAQKPTPTPTPKITRVFADPPMERAEESDREQEAEPIEIPWTIIGVAIVTTVVIRIIIKRIRKRKNNRI